MGSIVSLIRVHDAATTAVQKDFNVLTDRVRPVIARGVEEKPSTAEPFGSDRPASSTTAAHQRRA